MPKNSEKGFVLVAIMVVIGSFGFIIAANMSKMNTKNKLVRNLGNRVSASLLSERIRQVVAQSQNQDNLFSTLDIGGVAINQGPANLGISCILNFKKGDKSKVCQNIEFPTVYSKPCNVYLTEEEKKLCWIFNNMKSYTVDVLLPKKKGPYTQNDIVIDNRSPSSGLTRNFNICNSFNTQGSIVTQCPYRLQTYAWVTCNGGAPTCGGSTGISGQITLSAILIADDRLRPFNPLKYSLLEQPGGSL